jgi:hypothetical protein
MVDVEVVRDLKNSEESNHCLLLSCIYLSSVHSSASGQED